jgi:hypothetical protein
VTVEEIRDEWLIACAEFDYRLEQLHELLGD